MMNPEVRRGAAGRGGGGVGGPPGGGVVGGRALAQGIATLWGRLSPGLIAVGGGAYEIPGLERGLLEALGEPAQASAARPRVERAIFGAHSSLEGAVELARSAAGG